MIDFQENCQYSFKFFWKDNIRNVLVSGVSRIPDDSFQLSVQVYIFRREAVSDSQKFVWTFSGLEKGVQVNVNTCMNGSF